MHARELTLTDGPRASGGRSSSGARATHSLVLWSGGVESTYTLLRLLRETRDRVLSHHVTILGVDGDGACSRRSALEGSAIEALRASLAACTRDFEHTRSLVDPGVQGAAGDAALLAFMAARVALARGFTPFDRVLVGVNGDRDPGWDPATAACALRRARMARAIRAAYGCDETPQVYLWEPRPHRRTMLGYLGAELAALTVSCRRPLAAAAGAGGVRPCGECAGCLARGTPSDGSGLSPSAETDPAERRPPLFRHLVELQSRRQGSPGADAASDPPGP